MPKPSRVTGYIRGHNGGIMMARDALVTAISCVCCLLERYKVLNDPFQRGNGTLTRPPALLWHQHRLKTSLKVRILTCKTRIFRRLIVTWA